MSLRPKEEEPRLDRLCRCCPALSYKQRLAGMACCMLAGLLLSLSSLLSFTQATLTPTPTPTLPPTPTLTLTLTLTLTPTPGGRPPLALPCTPAGCVELLQRSEVLP